MRKHRLYGFCLALATLAGVALQRPGTADAATATLGLPIPSSTTHHHHRTTHHRKGTIPAALDGLIGVGAPPTITNAPHIEGTHEQGSANGLMTAPRPTSGSGQSKVRLRLARAELQAENLQRLAAAVRWQDQVALAELAHAATEEQLARAYQAFQAAAAAQHAAAAAAAPPVVPASAPTSGGAWAALRQCESGGNYAENTGNGYYGAYQFSLGTWESLGYSGLPSSAPPAEQDAAAQALQARSGWGQWPVCSQKLGL
jgi:hypothetical protein